LDCRVARSAVHVLSLLQHPLVPVHVMQKQLRAVKHTMVVPEQTNILKKINFLFFIFFL